MKNRKLAMGAAGVCVALAASGIATARTAKVAAVPAKATITEKQTFTFKPNRYVKDTLRWARDVYTVKSGGTLHVVDNVVTEGPHTFTIVRKKDQPKTPKQFEQCKICETLGQAHGADPNSDAPPKFQFLEDGTGSETAPDIDKPGDSALVGQGKKGEFVDLKVTAKKGTTLYFMCIIHSQMQGKILVR